MMIAGPKSLKIDLGAISKSMPEPLLTFTILDYDLDVFLPPLVDENLIEQVYYCTTMSINAELNFAAYWSKRSKKLRDNMRRYFKRADDADIDVKLVVNTTVESIQSAIGRYADIETAGWKGRAGTAISRDNLQKQFYSCVLKRFAERRCATIFELQANNAVISSRLAIRNDKSVIFLKTTYDEEYSRISPGRLLLYLTLENLLGRGGIQNIEFYTKANRDQLQWSTSRRDIVHLNIYRNHALHTCIITARRIKNLLTANSTEVSRK
jgi:hypothetical protein